MIPATPSTPHAHDVCGSVTRALGAWRTRQPVSRGGWAAPGRRCTPGLWMWPSAPRTHTWSRFQVLKRTRLSLLL